MKGLFIKDCQILKKQKTFFLVILIFAFIQLLFFEGQDNFSILFVTLTSTMMTISTISYDEFDNGLLFLFTLPISKKTYAKEKYVFGGVYTAFSCLFITLLNILIGLVHQDMITLIVINACIALYMALLIMSLMIPIQLKFGAEKGRIVMILVVMVGFALCSIFFSLFSLMSVLSYLKALPMAIINILLILFLMLCIYISIQISTHILEKKQL